MPPISFHVEPPPLPVVVITSAGDRVTGIHHELGVLVDRDIKNAHCERMIDADMVRRTYPSILRVGIHDSRAHGEASRWYHDHHRTMCAFAKRSTWFSSHFIS